MHNYNSRILLPSLSRYLLASSLPTLITFSIQVHPMSNLHRNPSVISHLPCTSVTLCVCYPTPRTSHAYRVPRHTLYNHTPRFLPFPISLRPQTSSNLMPDAPRFLSAVYTSSRSRTAHRTTARPRT